MSTAQLASNAKPYRGMTAKDLADSEGTKQRARAWLDGMTNATRAEKVAAAKSAGVFELLRDDWNEHGGQAFGELDEDGNPSRTPEQEDGAAGPGLIQDEDGNDTVFKNTAAGWDAYEEEMRWLQAKGRPVKMPDRARRQNALAQARPDARQAVADANEYRAQASPRELAAVERAKVQREAQKELTDKDHLARLNSDLIAEYKRTGRKYYVDKATGHVVGETHEDGAPRYTPDKGRKVGGGYLESRDDKGERNRYRASLVKGDNPADGVMNWQYAPHDFEPAGHFEDLMNSDEPAVAKAAKAEYLARLKQVRDAATRPLYKAIDAASIELESGKAELADIPNKLKAMDDSLTAAAQAGHLEIGRGGIKGHLTGQAKGWQAKTEAGAKLLADLEALKQRQTDLINDTKDDWRSEPGRLQKAKLGALAQRNVAKDMLRGYTIEELIAARSDYVARNDGDPSKDAVIAEIKKSAAKLGFRLGPAGEITTESGAKVGMGADGHLRVTGGTRPGGPQGWDEVPQDELDAGPKGTPAAEGEVESRSEDAGEDGEEPDAFDQVLQAKGLKVPTYKRGQNVGGVVLDERGAQLMNERVPLVMRSLLKGEAMDNLDRYSGERAAGLFGRAVEAAERNGLAQLKAKK